MRVRERLERLKNDLRNGINPTDEMLLARLEACGVEGDERYRCRTPACYRCRCINKRKQQRETVKLFGKLSNENVVWVTVVLGATSNIEGLRPLIAKSRQDTRNCFVSARGRDFQWNGTHLKAWHEIDAVGAEHLPLLPSERSSLISSLAPMAGETSLPTWLPTWHGLMKTNGLSLDEIAVQFRRQWKQAHQVDVRLLNIKKALVANLENQASYANKFHTTTTLQGGVKEPWPVAWESKFFGWLDSVARNPFEALRLSVREHNPVAKLQVCKHVEVLSPMPFVHSSTSFPMYNNTGTWA